MPLLYAGPIDSSLEPRQTHRRSTTPGLKRKNGRPPLKQGPALWTVREQLFFGFALPALRARTEPCGKTLRTQHIHVLHQTNCRSFLMSPKQTTNTPPEQFKYIENKVASTEAGPAMHVNHSATDNIAHTHTHSHTHASTSKDFRLAILPEKEHPFGVPKRQSYTTNWSSMPTHSNL